MLAGTKDEDARIKAAFEFRAAVIAGFAPALDACSCCGKEVGDDTYLDVMNGALLCAGCLSRKTALLPLQELDETGSRNILAPLCASAVAALRFVLTAPPKRIFAFRLTDAHAEELFARAAEVYLLHHLERGFAALENYKRLLAIRRQMIKS